MFGFVRSIFGFVVKWGDDIARFSGRMSRKTIDMLDDGFVWVMKRFGFNSKGFNAGGRLTKFWRYKVLGNAEKALGYVYQGIGWGLTSFGVATGIDGATRLGKWFTSKAGKVLNNFVYIAAFLAVAAYFYGRRK